MAIEFPTGVKSRGRTALAIGLVRPTNLSAPSLATNLALAGAGLNGSFYVYGDVNFGDGINTGNAPRRFGSGRQFQQFGDRTSAAAEIMVVWDPQDDDTADINELKALMADGAELYLYIRRGPDARTVEFAATNTVEVRHVRIDGGHPGKTGDEEFDEFAWVCTAIDLEDPVYDAVLAA